MAQGIALGLPKPRAGRSGAVALERQWVVHDHDETQAVALGGRDLGQDAEAKLIDQHHTAVRDRREGGGGLRAGRRRGRGEARRQGCRPDPPVAGGEPLQQPVIIDPTAGPARVVGRDDEGELAAAMHPSWHPSSHQPG